MSTFESGNYQWRETYFVLFDSSQRPTAARVKELLGKLDDRFTISNPQADDKGNFESVTVLAGGAYAALDISYLAGEEVLEQGSQLAEELEELTEDEDELTKISRLPVCDARFDVLHFEDMSDAEGEEGGRLDPSALLLVLEALVTLSDGVAVDPQGGSLV